MVVDLMVIFYPIVVGQMVFIPYLIVFLPIYC